MCNAWNHPAACTCGWGGDGHLGRSYGPTFGYPVGRFTWADTHRDSCRATTCRNCGDQVFFVRHNGGVAWFDELGWPWPKHRCHTHDRHEAHLRRVLDELGSRGTHADIGVILEAETTLVGPLGRLLVRRGNGSNITVEHPNNVDFSSLPGRLVVLERDAGRTFATLVEPGELRTYVYLQVIEVASARVIDEFPFPQRTAAEQRLRALNLQRPGGYRMEKVKRTE